MQSTKQIAVGLLIAGFSLCALAAEGPEGDIRANIESLFEVEVDSVKPAPVDGLYEVRMGAQISYATADGRFLLTGDILSMDERVNLSDRRRSEIRARMFAEAAPYTVEFSPADAEHFVYIFTDTDCGYCRKMHQEVAELNEAGIGVRYLAFPRGGLQSKTFETMRAVWCSDDKQDAMTLAKQGQSLDVAECDSPVASQYELGGQMGVQGTPAVYLESGEEVGGYVPADQLKARLLGLEQS